MYLTYAEGDNRISRRPRGIDVWRRLDIDVFDVWSRINVRVYGVWAFDIPRGESVFDVWRTGCIILAVLD